MTKQILHYRIAIEDINLSPVLSGHILAYHSLGDFEECMYQIPGTELYVRVHKLGEAGNYEVIPKRRS